MLQIRLLGGLDLKYMGRTLDTVTSSRSQSLLAYLLLHRDAPLSRAHLAFLLWADSTEAQAHTNLRKQLHNLRHALPNPDAYLLITPRSVQWNPNADFSLDVAEFEDLLNSPTSLENLTRAADLYRGDFLPNCYDEWAAMERERLYQANVEALATLVRRLELCEDCATAVRYAERLVRLEPVRETGYQTLMRLHLRLGDRAAALHAYHVCETRLRRELGIAPGAALQRLRASVTAECFSDLAPTIPHPLPLVGREAELQRALDICVATTGTGPQLILISGARGIGKTRLVEEVCAEVTRQQGHAFMATCYPEGKRLSFGAMTDWLRAFPLPHLDTIWLAELSRVLPELVVQYPDLESRLPLAANWQLQRLYTALRYAFADAPQPCLFVLDNIEWCDEDTLAWLAAMMRPVSPSSIRVLATAGGPAPIAGPALGHLLDALCSQGCLRVMELQCLDERQTVELAELEIGRPLPAELAADVYRESQGNPLFIAELVRAIPLDQLDGSLADNLTRGAMPSALQTALTMRMTDLTPLAYEIMEIAASFGHEFGVEAVQMASGYDEATVLRILDDLTNAGILRKHGHDAYGVSYDGLQETACRGPSGPSVRRTRGSIPRQLGPERCAGGGKLSGDSAR